MKKLFSLFCFLVLFSCTDPSLFVDDEIKGCLDPKSVNYNPQAIINDGSCAYVDTSQNSIVGKFTATWCGPCGNWGGPSFVNLYETYKGDVLAISLQVNDNLTTIDNGPLVDQFSTKWQYTGTPNFFVNDVFVGTAVNQIGGEIQAKKSQRSKLGIAVHKTMGAGDNKGKFNVNVWVKAFENLSGNYYLSALFLHKQIVSPQNIGSGADDNYVHHHVLAKSASLGGAFGEPIFTSLNKGESFKWSRVIPYDSTWDLKNIELVFIVWKKSGNSYEFVNCTSN